MPPSPITRFLQTHTRLIAVVAGGLVGAGLRTVVARSIPWAGDAWTGDGWPIATLAVNLIGAAGLGFYLARHRASMTRSWSIDFWAIGLLGSLTTFSALSLEVVLLIDAGRTGTAAAYAFLSPLLGLTAARAGQISGTSRW